jgi:exosortase
MLIYEDAVSHSLKIAPEVSHTQARSLPPLRGWQIGLITVLIAWTYAPTLASLVSQWWHDPNFSHGFFVPLFSAYVVWEERHYLGSLCAQPSWSGLVLLAGSLVILIVGVLGADLFLSRVSFVLVLGSLVVLFLGWSILREVLFPLCFLFLMIPIPAIVFNEITFPLQIIASKSASAILPLLGVPVLREGNVIRLPAMALEVAEACSGIRSLLSLVTLAIIYGYLLEKRLVVRVLLALASIPIAVAANSFRIVGTGLLVQYWDADKAQGFFHAFSGWLIFIVSLLLLFALHRLLLRLWPTQGQPA